MKYFTNLTKEQAQKIARTAIGASLFVIAVGGAFYFGYERGRENPKRVVVENVINTEPNGRLEAEDFGIFWEAWDMLKRDHVAGEALEDRSLIYGAISGLVDSLGDPHTVFLPPEDSKKFEEDVSGNFGGIGAEIGIRNNQLAVIAPLKGTPADQAGLKAGDEILAVDGEGTQGIDVNEAVKRIRGEIGTEVTLTIMREGWEAPREIKIIRANIQVPTLEMEIVEVEGKKLAHIQLFSFNQNAPALFYRAVLELLIGGADGIVLDLRNNPGGFLEVSVNLAGWYLNQGEAVVFERFRTGDEIAFRATGNAAIRDVPTVVLVNKGSASASEILAGALRAQLGISLIGTPTFGKGTVQELRPLRDGSTVKLTIANWVLPDGTVIEEGLVPDYEVELKEDDFDENGELERDAQLEKAIEVLLGRL